MEKGSGGGHFKRQGIERVKAAFRGRDKKICLVIALMAFVLASACGNARQNRADNRDCFQNGIDSRASSGHVAYKSGRLESNQMEDQDKSGEPINENLTPRVSGGPCEYKIYKGLARIISIRKKEMPKGYGGPSHESYEVKFSFSTEEEIKEAHGKVEGREYTLKLTNSWYPGPKFLKKYGIEEGKSFDCDLKVITKGTCSPVLFDFPTIDLSDYFESRR